MTVHAVIAPNIRYYLYAGGVVNKWTRSGNRTALVDRSVRDVNLIHEKR
jgi:hypothetical protein